MVWRWSVTIVGQKSAPPCQLAMFGLYSTTMLTLCHPHETTPDMHAQETLQTAF